MDMRSPSSWNARVNYDNWSDTPYIKDLIAVHWGGPPPNGYDLGPAKEANILRRYEDYHLDEKGWRGIAYGYAIGASGTVYRLRGKNNYGAHSGDYDNDGVSNNKEIIPVLFIMGKGQTATPAMWASLIELRFWLQERPWTTGDLPVSGHRVVSGKNTECPGDDNMKIISSANWAWRPDPVKTPAEWVRDMEERWEWTQSNAVEVAQQYKDSNLAFQMGVNGTPMDGYLLLQILKQGTSNI